MSKRGSLRFTDVKRPITSPSTKFGGQPNWLADPQWPISRSTNEQMRFIGQIVIPKELFPNAAGKVAYIFMADYGENVGHTWEPYSGENAVIIQPANEAESPLVEVVGSATGPTLQRYVKKKFSRKRYPRDVELDVEVAWEEEPDFIPEDDLFKLPDDEGESYCDAIQGTKLGGAPAFVQRDEYPDAERNWSLLLQIDSCDGPFYVNFGDSGVAYVYIDDDVRRGRMLWQCS